MKIDNMNETNIPTNKSDRTKEQEAAFVTKFGEVVTKAKGFTQQIHLNRVSLLKLMLEAKVFGFNKYEMASVYKELGYSRSTKCKVKTVIDSEVLMTRLDKLPSSYATLYQLRLVEEQDLDDFIESQLITVSSSHDAVVKLLKGKGIISDNEVDNDSSGNCPIKFNYDKANASADAIKVIDAFELTIVGYKNQLEQVGYKLPSITINLEELMVTRIAA